MGDRQAIYELDNMENVDMLFHEPLLKSSGSSCEFWVTPKHTNLYFRILSVLCCTRNALYCKPFSVNINDFCYKN